MKVHSFAFEELLHTKPQALHDLHALGFDSPPLLDNGREVPALYWLSSTEIKDEYPVLGFFGASINELQPNRQHVLAVTPGWFAGFVSIDEVAEEQDASQRLKSIDTALEIDIRTVLNDTGANMLSGLVKGVFKDVEKRAVVPVSHTQMLRTEVAQATRGLDIVGRAITCLRTITRRR